MQWPVLAHLQARQHAIQWAAVQFSLLTLACPNWAHSYWAHMDWETGAIDVPHAGRKGCCFARLGYQTNYNLHMCSSPPEDYSGYHQ